VRIAA